MRQIFKNKKRLNRGFTLVEALVAVAIVLLGVTAAFTSAQFGLSSTSAVRNRVTAIYLAQEALEGVKNIKDSNLQNISLNNGTNDWLDGISAGVNAPCMPGEFCGYDPIAGGLVSCDDEEDCLVTIISYNSNEVYVQRNASGEEIKYTDFVRTIEVEELNDNEARVTVTISGINNIRLNPFTASSIIYNWF